jgi:hypothetical protein
MKQFLAGIHAAAERLVDQRSEHQRVIDHYRKVPM